MVKLSDPRVVEYTPIATTLLLEYANVGQLYRMWREHSALGQNVWSWLAVNAALWLWLNFYVQTGNLTWAVRATKVGIALNTAVVLTVAYFRYMA